MLQSLFLWRSYIGLWTHESKYKLSFHKNCNQLKCNMASLAANYWLYVWLSGVYVTYMKDDISWFALLSNPWFFEFNVRSDKYASKELRHLHYSPKFTTEFAYFRILCSRHLSAHKHNNNNFYSRTSVKKPIKKFHCLLFKEFFWVLQKSATSCDTSTEKYQLVASVSTQTWFIGFSCLSVWAF